MNLRIISIRVVLVLGVALSAANIFGQSAIPAGTAPVQVPLSGRGVQAGAVATGQSPIPGATASVNTLNPTIQVSGPYSGSVSGAGRAFTGQLSLKEALDRGMEFNLGTRGLSTAVQQAHGQTLIAHAALTPNIFATGNETIQQNNLAAQGFHITAPIPGFSFPTVVGPFNYMDLRARLSQSVLDFAALNNYRSSVETLHANEFFAKDAKDLVALAVGGAYLQTLAAKSRVIAARAQLETANILFKQNGEQRSAGLIAQLDVNKSQVQVLTQQQRVVSLENDLAKQKISLARLIGLPPNGHFDLSDDILFAAAPPLAEEDAVRQALAQRPDIKGAEAQIRASERTKAAAQSEKRPTVAFNADYGVIGKSPFEAHGTFSITGSVRIPLWQGRRTEGDIEVADAALQQRKSELEDLRSRVESEVRNSYLDMQSATSQVEVSRRNLEVSKETLDLTRQRFDAGITNSLEVSQAQAAVASAELDVINAVFAHNVAKLSLARTQGNTTETLQKFLQTR